MKKFWVCCCLLSMLLFSGCSSPVTTAVGGENVYVRNPDCGFYMPLGVTLTADEARCSLSDSSLRRNALLHLRVNIGAFSNGGALTEQALSGLGGLLETLRAHSVNAVIRFAYDGFNGKADCEPALERILAHVEQLSGVLYHYPDVLTAIEAGMIGPWGEMHSSALANKESFNALLGAWLSGTEPTTPVLARRPKFVADYIGIDVKELRSHTAQPGTDAYRLGVFNDGYLGSANDLGTYVDREGEIEWLNKQAAHLPFGGEVTIPGSEYNKIDYAAKEMFFTHTSYLNELWNDKVVAEWKSTLYTESAGTDSDYYGKTAYEYIRDHLGYRFVLQEVTLPKTAKKSLTVSLKVKSDGFGNLNKAKRSELVLKNETGSYAVAVDLDARDWLCGSEHRDAFTADISAVPAGEYTVYLRLSEPEADGALYPVAFANGVFDETVLANRLGVVRLK